MNISVVIPARAEENNVIPTYDGLIKIFGDNKEINNFEIIFVDDGSLDGTFKKLQTIADSRVKILQFVRPRGKSAAIKEGIKTAVFEIIAILDADLQYYPADILKMLTCLRGGTNFVIGKRKIRRDSIIRRISSAIGNGFNRLILKSKFKDNACGLCVFQKKVLSEIDFFEGSHRFFPFLAQKRGFRVEECEIDHRARQSGKSKYGILNRIFKTASDLIRVWYSFAQFKN